MITFEDIKNTYQEMTVISEIEKYERPLLLKIALYKELEPTVSIKKAK